METAASENGGMLRVAAKAEEGGGQERDTARSMQGQAASSRLGFKVAPRRVDEKTQEMIR